MRFLDLITEDAYTDSLNDEIITLLTTAAAEGIGTVNTSQLLNDLVSQGYSVDQDLLIGELSKLSMVQNVTADEISLSAEEDNADLSQQQQDDFDVQFDQDDNDHAEIDTVGNLATKKSIDSLRNDL